MENYPGTILTSPYIRSYIHWTIGKDWKSGHGRSRGHWGTGGYGRCSQWWGGGNLSAKLLVPVEGAAVAEGPDALPALCDVEGAPGTRVRHWNLSEAVLTAATLELLLVMILWRQNRGKQQAYINLFSISPVNDMIMWNELLELLVVGFFFLLFQPLWLVIAHFLFDSIFAHSLTSHSGHFHSF